ncbi:MAG: hypothetical protein LBH06_05680, partial [Rikenellaceae bacterium]|nr:hypothetical protein [Rikenellaceae bacterium]
MKTKIIFLALCCAAASGVQGREVKEGAASEKWWRDLHVGVHTGLDMGGAVPWPLSNAVGGGNKMNAVPRLT